MRAAAAVSSHPVAAAAVGEVLGQVLDGLGHAPDAAIVAIAGEHRHFSAEVIATVRSVLAPGVHLGIGAAGLLAGPTMISGAGVAILAVSEVAADGVDEIATRHGSVARLTVAPGDAVPSPGSRSAVDGAALDLAAGSGFGPLTDDGHVALAPRGIELDGVAATALQIGAGLAISRPLAVTEVDGRYLLRLGDRPAGDVVRAGISRHRVEHDLERIGPVLLAAGEPTEGPDPLAAAPTYGIVGVDRRRGVVELTDPLPVGAVAEVRVVDVAATRRRLVAAIAGRPASVVLLGVPVGVAGGDPWTDALASQVAEVAAPASVLGIRCAATATGSAVGGGAGAVSALVVGPG